MTPDAEQWRVACHEAGHALAACLLDRALGCCLFDGGGGMAALAPPASATTLDATGHTASSLHGRWAGKPTEAILDDCAVYAAGKVAEAIIITNAAVPGFVAVTGPDAQMIESAALTALNKYPSIEGVNAWRSLAVACAWRLLRPHADSIRAIALALQERRSLSAADVAEIHLEQTRKETELCTADAAGDMCAQS
ncbi:MAG: hypothetical protein RBT03_05410 [Kiritimatiellia bacterium]|jgi:ATP-dependent Zn protease|nr:hypothetical protein [Kiritimatiellia bacterium]